ncbi:MAG: exodeoxyribonuclease V subunit gamma [Rhodocyclaceae bacterium]|nr:exodeoxyribonuclease V subunit gamma [Rhodocyclaceae bacterium]
MIIHGNRPELLRQLLVRWYRAHPLLPLEDEIVLVQSNGIAQWLKLALAEDPATDGTGGCGVAAALRMLLPSRFVWQAYRAVLGREAVPESSPFDKPLLLWRLMRLLPQLLARPGYGPLAGFLAEDRDLRKRYQLAEKIADLFDQYQVYRADWLDAWASGSDLLLDARGAARPLDATQRWQPLLWRALLDDVGEAGRTSRAAVHRDFLAATGGLRSRPNGLPRRISVFGLSSLPRQSLEVLRHLSRFSQVILCVHNPCEHYWADLLTERDQARRTSRRHARKAGTPAAVAEADLHLHTHPLLASWGRQGRDYIALLDEIDEPDAYRGGFEQAGERIDLFEGHGESTLLHQLQEDIRLFRPARETRDLWPPVDPARDRSIRFHVAHSPQREVEVLHDQLLAAFSADPTLRPRDVIVMVPDVDAYAPHIEAVFGQIDRDDTRFIPYAIADQAVRHRSPLVGALEFLLASPESRMAVSDLLDLLDVPAIRRRFGIEAADLPMLRRWIRQANIRWGLDAAHRRKLVGADGASDQNTWRQGLRRMLLGYAAGGDPLGAEDCDWHGIEPFAEVAGLDAAAVGPLARLLRGLERIAGALATPAPPEAWDARLQALLADFLEGDGPEDALLLLELKSALRAWVEACQAAGLTEPLPLSVVRDHWLGQLDQPGLARRFLAGRLTFATLMPMRAIPFRMVCLLGMNDGEFPRARAPVDFDLMARDLRPGDRSRREDDRYLFLEALLSARERLHVSWIGRSVHDNSRRPPAVPVSQLRDHLEGCWRLAPGGSGERLLPALTVEHRLQAFSPDYFGHTPADSPLFTYAREWERSGPASKSAGAEGPLPAVRFEAPVQLGQLAAFLRDPVKAFFRERLRVSYEMEELAAEDDEPFSLDALAQYGLQDLLIKARLEALRDGQSETGAVSRQLARIRRRGELPIGVAADLAEAALLDPLDNMFERYDKACADWPETLDDEDFEHGVEVDGQVIRVQGRLTRLRGQGTERCRIELSSSNLIDDRKYRHERLISAWVHHLASHRSGQPTGTRVVGKDASAWIAPLDTDTARKLFEAIVRAYAEGMRRPLPLALRTGFAWVRGGGSAVDGPLSDADPGPAGKARRTYEDGFQYTGEGSGNPYLRRRFPSFDALWSDGGFSRLCEELLAPLVEHVGESADGA